TDLGFSPFTGDLDADGDPDWISSPALIPRMNDGSGTLLQIDGDVVLPVLGMSVPGDVGGDGDPDAVSCGGSPGTSGPFLVGLNDGFGNFAPDPAFCATGPCRACGLAESFFSIALDGDGDLDLFVGHPVNTIFRNVGGSFVPASLVPLSGLPPRVARGD